ncbi:MAG TPA: NADH-quinone oxidoreductase subunit C, partial [Bacteroidales bacterium]|nr:NADH-quinone oxidoreductase subunit C [Bacteroidales bacterium]
MKYIEIVQNPGKVAVSDIPLLDYASFMKQTEELLKKSSCHCLNYFMHRSGKQLIFYILIANDDSHKILVYSHSQPADLMSLESITRYCFPMHIFEREISENTGISFSGHPWLKPLRYPHDRSDKSTAISDYPFYKIESEETHEVGVGPIHAGIIEPGHFRFLCHGEKVLHLEIQLGYQHRGVEKLFLEKKSLLQQSVLSESIAGDTAIGHGLAFAQLAEILSDIIPDERLEIERTIALEMERMAVHIGDTAALCGDVAYQLGQSACEALRTIVINTTQDWCGNRVGKGL